MARRRTSDARATDLTSQFVIAPALPITIAAFADAPAPAHLRHDSSVTRITLTCKHSVVVRRITKRRFGGKSRHAHSSLLCLSRSTTASELERPTSQTCSAEPAIVRLHQTLFAAPIVTPSATHAAQARPEVPRGDNHIDAWGIGMACQVSAFAVVERCFGGKSRRLRLVHVSLLSVAFNDRNWRCVPQASPARSLACELFSFRSCLHRTFFAAPIPAPTTTLTALARSKAPRRDNSVGQAGRVSRMGGYISALAVVERRFGVKSGQFRIHSSLLLRVQLSRCGSRNNEPSASNSNAAAEPEGSAAGVVTPLPHQTIVGVLALTFQRARRPF